MLFVKATDQDGKEVIINLDHVEILTRRKYDDEKFYTRVGFVSGCVAHVKEKPTELCVIRAFKL